ncbi:efflux RND transporter permease subunit [Bacillota bacterium]
MDISKISINRPVTTAMMVLVIILVGTVSLMGIPMDLLPDIEFPVAIVYVQYPDAGPEEVEAMITKPLEQALASVENMDNIMSMTMEETAIVMVQFAMKTDMNFATLNMREKIALVEGFLPSKATDPMVLKMSMDFTPVVQVYVSSEKPLAELNHEINDNIISYFERSKGVASVDSFGGITEEVSVKFDQERLSGYGLTMSAISQLLAAENINMPGGEISKGSSKVIVRTLGEFSSVDDIRQLPLTLTDRSIIRLSDLASIELGYKEQTSISRVGGISSIGLSISKQSTANTIEVSNGIEKTIEKLRSDFPDLTFTIGMDQSDYIKSSIFSVRDSAIMGAILAIIVIFLFLRNISATMIIAISIPTSFFATFAVMNLMGMTLNLITLTALTLAVGMLVDNSVVALENIFRVSQHENTASSKEAALIGSRQIALAISASTLTSIVVYLPIALSDGIASLLFVDFCWTFIISLVVSLVVAITVVPMLSSKLLDREASTDYIRIGKHHYNYRLIPYFTRFINWLTAYYGNAIKRALYHRKKTIIICLIVFIVSGALVAVVGMEFMPASDEGSFAISVATPYGTSLEDKDRLVRQIEAYVLELPELSLCSVDIGLTSSFYGSQASTLNVILLPKQERDRSIWEVIDDIKQEFRGLSGAEISIIEAASITSMMGGSDLDITIKGPELDVLRTLGGELSEMIKSVPGVAETGLSIEEGNPEVRVKLDRNTAAFYGITAYQLANSLSGSLAGSTSTNLKIDGKEIEVNLSLSDIHSTSIDNMRQIQIPSMTGATVPVGQIASLEFGNAPSRIDRMNQERYITISVSVGDNDLAKISDKIFALIDEYPFPDGYSYEDGGLYEQMIEAFADLFLALLVAILLVYMVLASQFESLTQPFIIMIAIPFAVSGTFLALFLTGKTLSITSFLGLIMLVGIVVNNSILLIEFIKLGEGKMPLEDALIQAGIYRLRPILMTTVTTVVGMIPLSLGFGDGGEILSPLGISIIGGLIGSTIVTLILVPVLYAMMNDAKAKRNAKKIIRRSEINLLEEQWKSENAIKMTR